MEIRRATIDDLMHEAFEKLLSEGNDIQPSKGAARELVGVTLRLSNPRARLSRSEGRGKVFSALGEMLWYLAGSRELSFVEYYIKPYRSFSDDKKTLYGAYGPRLFDGGSAAPMAKIRELLKCKPATRQAVIPLFRPEDVGNTATEDLPCTTSLQFLLRKDQLVLITTMRSNDACIGFPHDVFFFTMLQELVARGIGVELGEYVHCVGSFHVYDKDKQKVESYLSEGYQPTNKPMPSMPAGDQEHALRLVLELEKQIRTDPSFHPSDPGLDDYWMDLVRLLLAYRASESGNFAELSRHLASLSSPSYKSYVEDRAYRQARRAP